MVACGNKCLLMRRAGAQQILARMSRMLDRDVKTDGGVVYGLPFAIGWRYFVQSGELCGRSMVQYVA